jgi:hypothetical protein
VHKGFDGCRKTVPMPRRAQLPGPHGEGRVAHRVDPGDEQGVERVL